MISIVIPTFNEAEIIAGLVQYLFANGSKEIKEIIVVDGGSDDKTVELAQSAGAITVIAQSKGRASQMNLGASMATGEILYFIHADTKPPSSFIQDINDAIANGFTVGRYRTQFDSNKWVLKLNAYFTRFDLFMCYGGDQTLFIQQQLFASIGGFNTSFSIMEDYEIVERAKKLGRYKIFKKGALVSARKYELNSWLTVQKANYTIVKMYQKGAPQQEMTRAYKALLNYR